jgi:hypothetical protein
MAKAEPGELILPPAQTSGASGPVQFWDTEPSIMTSKFFSECASRLVSGRDMNIVITAASETGVGKTTLAVALAFALDQHGWTADKATVAQPAQYDHKYDQARPGSVLILDEAEKAADARRGMSSESVTISQTFATKRYRQVFSILTAPSKSWIDKRLGSDAADYWMQAQETDLGRVKGEAKVYRLRTNEHYEQDYTERTEVIHWPNLDGVTEFDKLNERKETLLESDEGTNYVAAEDVEKAKQQAKKSASKEYRNRTIRKLAEDSDLTYSEIGEVFDISSSRVNQVVDEG